MVTMNAICEQCYKHFIVSEEISLPIGITYHRYRKNSKITKWSQWVEYLSTHCESCRIQEIPEEVKNDYHKYIRKER